jgi:hypothetical protein
MDLSRPPQVGAVICFRYLWQREFAAGLVEGAKARPCLVIAVEPERGEGPAQPWITVVPITHRVPAHAAAIAVPAETKRRLRLDDDLSWIVLGEANAFLWPGYDVHPAPGSQSWLYGYVGRGLFTAVRRKLMDLLQAGPPASPVDRSA